METTGTIVGFLIVFMLPWGLYQLGRLFIDGWILWEDRKERIAYAKTPAGIKEALANEEKARRRAVEAHREANAAEHKVWQNEYDRLYYSAKAIRRHR